MSTTTTTTKLLTVAQTVAVLAHELGAGRQWSDALNDHRRDRGSIQGLQLLPTARKPGAIGNCPQPLYHPLAVQAFIGAMRELFGMKKPFASTASTYTFDRTWPASDRYWFARTAHPVEVTARPA